VAVRHAPLPWGFRPMAEVTGPVLDIDRVFLLDRRNQKFVEKTSPVSARVQDARDSLGGMALILIFVGAVLFLAVSTHVTDSRLIKGGRVTTGIIIGKTQTHQDAVFCHVTYRFSAPAVYEREAQVRYQLCDSFAVGQPVEVVYDPQQPVYSNLERSMESPKYPVWPVAVGFLGVLAAIYPQFSKLQTERRLCAEGQVICGSLVSKDIDLDHLTMRYRFRAPGGSTIESEAEGSVRRSNWSHDSQFFPDKPNLVAVLFLSEAEFYLL
jgi:hypothetical protein